jgi:hypothetical protein
LLSYQSVVSVAISYIISVYCEDYAGYFTAILSFLAFHFCSAYFIYLVSCNDPCKVDLIGLILQNAQETTEPDRAGTKIVVKSIGPEGIDPILVHIGESPSSESKGKALKQRKLDKQRKSGMASSSRSKPTMEERLKTMEEEMKRIKNIVQNQDNIL